jgi:hypothetical protein
MERTLKSEYAWLLIASQKLHFMGRWRMPWEIEAMKDVGCLRKAAGRWLPTCDPQISEWGNPSRAQHGLRRASHGNPKSKILNSKQSQNPKTQNFLNFEI